MRGRAAILLFLQAVYLNRVGIYPFEDPDYRFTYRDYPHFILSSANNTTRLDDLVELPDQFTKLPIANKVVCEMGSEGNQEDGLTTCNKSGGDSDGANWEITDVYRVARICNQKTGKCMTLKKAKDDKDKGGALDIALKDLDEGDPKQLVLIANNHGLNNDAASKLIPSIANDFKAAQALERNKETQYKDLDTGSPPAA